MTLTPWQYPSLSAVLGVISFTSSSLNLPEASGFENADRERVWTIPFPHAPFP